MNEPSLSPPVPNLPLLRKVLDVIDADPAHWDQLWWEASADQRHERNGALYDARYGKCGTTRCVAGWVQWFEQGEVTDDSTSEVARTALGLTWAEARALFWETADASAPHEQRVAIQAVAEQIAARAGERL